jgi:hypothetical protein
VLDPRVVQSFANVRDELHRMYPDLPWQGEVVPGRVAAAREPPKSSFKEASLFTGGVDSTWTVLRHAGPQLLLISIWGNQDRLADAYRWAHLVERNRAFAARHAGGLVVAKSNFKSINYARLGRLTPQIRNWWPNVHLPLGLSGLAAPILYAYGIDVTYVASTVVPGSEITDWASQPRIDNLISLGPARLIHDAPEYSRQQKVEGIVDYVRQRQTTPPTLRVCFTDVPRSGGNCGRCEKCLRTQASLVAVGADPRDWGFPKYRPALLERVPPLFAARQIRFTQTQSAIWTDLAARAPAPEVVDSAFWSWLRTYDFQAYRQRQRDVPLLAWRRLDPLFARAPRLVSRLKRVRRFVREVTRN